MTDYFDRLLGLCRRAYEACFKGRVARGTFILRLCVLVGVIVLVIVPLTSVLSVSGQALLDTYAVAAMAVLVIAVLGIVSAFAKRLHDMGWPAYLAGVLLVVIPISVVVGMSWYQSYRWESDHTFDSTGLSDIAGWLALGLPVALAMRAGDAGENRFGPPPIALEHVWLSWFNKAAIIGAAIVLIPSLIFAGFFQSGIWVGRGRIAPVMPLAGSNADGISFIHCWNLKGVGAGSGNGPGSGIYRDGYDNTVFDFVVSPDGHFDIATAGGIDGRTYRQQGFAVSAYGIKQPAAGEYYSVGDARRFLIVASFNPEQSDGTINLTTFAFAKNKTSWPEFNVVMSTGLSSDNSKALIPGFPDARGRLMVGDCMSP